jgi:hypothetical protein
LKVINLLMRPVSVLAVLLTSACAGLSTPGNQSSEPLEQPSVQVNPAGSQTDVYADAAYDLMVAEIALNQGNTQLATERYIALAESQENPAIAERAVRVAVYGQDLEAAAVAAQRWIELDPGRVGSRKPTVSSTVSSNPVNSKMRSCFRPCSEFWRVKRIPKPYSP